MKRKLSVCVLVIFLLAALFASTAAAKTYSTSDYSTINSTKGIAVSKTTDCYLKLQPFEDTQTYRTVTKGGNFNIVGAVKNKWGNTWYKTSDGYYVYSGDVNVYTASDYSAYNSTKGVGISKNSDCYLKVMPFEDTTTKKTIAKSKSVNITGAVKNKWGNVWYKTSDGYFVYSGDVAFHPVTEYSSYNSKVGVGICSASSTIKEYPYAVARTIKSVTNGDGVTIKGAVKNAVGNIWYKTSDGYFVYSGDFTFHSLSEFSTVNSTKGIAFSKNNNCYIKQYPYEAAKTIKTVESGKDFNIAGTVKNLFGNTWYKTSDGYFVYSGDITLHLLSEYSTVNNVKGVGISNGTSCVVKAYPYAAANTIKTLSKGTNIKIIASVKNIYNNIWYKTSDGYFIYSADFDCYFTSDYSTYSSTTGTGVSKTSDCYLKEMPFEATKTIRIVAKGQSIKITGAVKNKWGNVWYKTSDGYFVYSGDVDFLPTLKITSQPASVRAPISSQVTFKVVATGDSLTYQWQYKTPGGSWTNSPTTGNRTATLSIPATASRNGYQYHCKVTDRYGNSVTSNAATLTVTGVKIDTQPKSYSDSSYAGKTVKFSVKASGVGLTYQWQFRKPGGSWTNSPATGNRTATLTVPATLSRNGYQYRCIVKNQNGDTVTSNAAKLEILFYEH